MKAAILKHLNSPLELVEDYPKPTPGARDVLVKVRACGVCGSDLLLIKGHLPPKLPVVPGHEAAGEIVEVGAEVAGVRIGDRVAVYYIHYCGQCHNCRSGKTNICERILRMGVDIDGAYAEYVKTPAQNVIPLPDQVDFAVGAVLTDAVATPYHALMRIAKLQHGETIAVFGIGGVGSNAVQIARINQALVIAISRKESKLQLSLELGAQHVIRADKEDVVARVKDLTNGEGVDVAIQCVGDARVDEQAIASIRKGGRVILVGGSAETFQMNSLEMIWREATIMGSRGFTKQDIQDVLDLYLRGYIKIQHLVRNISPLSEANQVLEDFKKGRILRAILIPSS